MFFLARRGRSVKSLFEEKRVAIDLNEYNKNKYIGISVNNYNASFFYKFDHFHALGSFKTF